MAFESSYMVKNVIWLSYINFHTFLLGLQLCLMLQIMRVYINNNNNNNNSSFILKKRLNHLRDVQKRFAKELVWLFKKMGL